jgi:hypothetical protein
MHSRASFRDKISCLKRERFFPNIKRAPPISKKLTDNRLAAEITFDWLCLSSIGLICVI